MTDRLHHALVALRAHFTPDADVREVERYLASRGLAPHEIDEVLARFAADPVYGQGGGVRRDVASTGSLRVQGPHERGRFDPDAWGYVLALHASGAAPPAVLEELVARALAYGEDVVSVQDLRSGAAELGLDPQLPSADHSLLH